MAEAAVKQVQSISSVFKVESVTDSWTDGRLLAGPAEAAWPVKFTIQNKRPSFSFFLI